MSVATPPPQTDPGEPQALIEEAWQLARRRRRRRRIAILAGLLVVGVGGLSWVALSSGPVAATDSARRPGLPVPTSGTLRYLYTRAVLAPSRSVAGGSATGIATVENWVGSDGTWRLRETMPGRANGSIDFVARGDGLLPPQSNATAAFNGVPSNPRDPGDGLFTDRELKSLPTSVPALSARLERAVTAQELRNLHADVGSGQHRAAQLARLRPVFVARQEADTLIAIAALDMSPIRGSLASALYRVARALPGVRVTPGRDALGRSGTQVSGGGFTLIFDSRSGALRSVSAGPFFDQGAAGTIVAQARVPNVYTIPHGLTPIRSLVATPPTITLAPVHGSSTTSFDLRVAVPRSQVRSPRAPALVTEVFGPTGPDCRYWLSRPPVVRIGPGAVTRRHQLAVASYRVAPEAIGRRVWCTGRYQLMLTTFTSASRIAVPRSFAATYFTVH